MHDLALHPAPGAGGELPLLGLSLCSGAGGLDLGLHIAEPGYRAVGYVERDACAAAVLVARMEDQALAPAPIWDDLASFDGRAWRDAVDLVLAGYPCQPFSVAGRRRGADDPRHLWPHVARIIGECQPRLVFLENVANHLNLGYCEVRGELEGLGFRVAEGLFSAEEVGAPHRRERLFVLGVADTDPARQPQPPRRLGQGGRRAGDHGEELADAEGQRREPAERRQSPPGRPDRACPLLGDAVGPRLEERSRQPGDARAQQPAAERAGGEPVFPPGPADEAGWRDYLRWRPNAVEALMGWPAGWTGFDSVATAWCRWLPRMRGELSRLGWDS